MGRALASWPGAHVLGESKVSPAFASTQAAYKALAYVRSSRARLLALRAVSH